MNEIVWGLLDYYVLYMIPKKLKKYNPATVKTEHQEIFQNILADIPDPDRKIANYEWSDPRQAEVKLIFWIYSVELRETSFYSELNYSSRTMAWKKDKNILKLLGPWAFALMYA